MAAEHQVMIYALTTCRWCKKTKQWFEEEQIPYEHVDVDRLEGEEHEAAAAKVEELSGGRSFPITVLDGDVIVGFKPEIFAERIKGVAGSS